jgi:indole-3-glycerol phosphate synthase
MAANILEQIANRTRQRVEEDKKRCSLEEMRALALQRAQAERAANAQLGLVDANGEGAFSFAFKKALAGNSLAFICEAKKASPSKGLIEPDFNPVAIAKDYEAAGAAAISCLTEPYWFLCSDTYLQDVVAAVSIPVLRKDFTVDEYMIYQAKVLGASAILLICAILSDKDLARYHALAESLGLSVLVEAHDAEEVKRALACGAKIVGVNNRNLKDFSVDFSNAMALRSLIPEDVIYVAESGISGAEDVARVAASGANAVLVGEALMRAENKPATLETFKQAARQAVGA